MANDCHHGFSYFILILLLDFFFHPLNIYLWFLRVFEHFFVTPSKIVDTEIASRSFSLAHKIEAEKQWGVVGQIFFGFILSP